METNSNMHKYINVCIIAYNIAHAYCLRFGLKGRELNTMLLLSPNFYSMHNSLSSTLLLSLSFSALSISLYFSLTSLTLSLSLSALYLSVLWNININTVNCIADTRAQVYNEREYRIKYTQSKLFITRIHKLVMFEFLLQ